jgi:hypothetical protein
VITGEIEISDKRGMQSRANEIPIEVRASAPFRTAKRSVSLLRIY